MRVKNGKSGIVISTGNLAGNKNQEISIDIMGHTNYASRFGIGIAGDCHNQPKGVKRISCEISLMDLRYYNTNEVGIRTYSEKPNTKCLNIGKKQIYKNNVPKSKLKSETDADKKKILHYYHTSLQIELR